MRDAIVIGVACLVAIAAGAWLYFGDTGEHSPNDASGTKVPVAVLSEGDNSGFMTERKNYRVKSRHELDQLWAVMYGSDGPSLSPVDFETSEVLAVFDGTHSSGGFDVEVTSVYDDALSRRVSITRTAPGEDCITSEAITSPFILVVVPKSDLPIAREETTVTSDCD